MNEQRILDNFLKFVQIDSPTKSEKEFALELTRIFEELGLSVEMDHAGDAAGSDSGNLIIKLKGTSESGTPLLMSSHMDTVSPSIGVKPVVKDGVVYSDGTTVLGADDKAGIAIILEAVQTIMEENIPHGDLEIVLSIHEEGGLLGSKHLDYSKINAKHAIVLDSGGDPGKIIVEGPSQNKFDATFIGKEGHAGFPEGSISAIQMLAEAIANMKLLRVDEKTTANIGSIEGGSATNIVANRASFKAEVRSLDPELLDAQTNAMKKACEDAAGKFGGQVELDIKNAYMGFRMSEDNELIQRVIAAAKALDIPTELASTGGGSDTNNFNLNDINAVNLAIGERKPHSVEEHIYIKDLNNAAKLVIEIIKQFA